MTKPMTTLLAALEEARLGPSVTTSQVNGKTTLRWHVDYDDDRYVEVVDSLHSISFVLHRRDNANAIIAVLDDIPTIVDWIYKQLLRLRHPEYSE